MVAGLAANRANSLAQALGDFAGNAVSEDVELGRGAASGHAQIVDLPRLRSLRLRGPFQVPRHFREPRRQNALGSNPSRSIGLKLNDWSRLGHDYDLPGLPRHSF